MSAGKFPDFFCHAFEFVAMPKAGLPLILKFPSRIYSQRKVVLKIGVL
jgi:hypothetical protein